MNGPPAEWRDTHARAPGIRDVVADIVLADREEAVYVLDGAWRIVYLNDAAAELKRRPRQELLGRNFWEAFPGAAGTGIEAAYRHAAAEGVPVRFETHYPPLDSWFEVRATPSDGLLVVRFRDITGREQARTALRATDERFRLAAEASGDVVWDYDFAAGTIWRSENFSRLFGYPAEEVGASFESWVERVHPAERERVVAAFERALQAGSPRLSLEYRFRASDGGYLHVLDRMRFLYDREGGPRRVVGVLADISDQKAAEERQRFLVEAGLALTETIDYRERLRNLARVCAGPLSDYCIVDVVEEDGAVRRIEVAHAEPDRDELARELLRFPPGVDGDRGVSRALSTGEAFLVERVDEAELERIAQSREHLEVLRALAPRAYLVVPLRADQRTLGAITLAITRPRRRFGPEDIALAEDLARQAALDLHNARLHRDLERAWSAAEQASRVKSQFLAMMSHELRTPLTAIIGMADLLEAEAAGPITGGQKDQVSRIKASAWHLVVLIDEILSYSRMEAGAEQLRILDADAVAVIGDAAGLLLPHAEAKGLELRCDLPDPPLPIRTDPGKLHQIVTNLLGNAIKFTEAGAVEVRARDHGGWLEVRVRDTGPGIRPEDQERIFEPFVQAEDPTIRRYPGAGLGLAISRRFADMLGGELSVHSAPGRGSTFTLRLPTAPE